MLEPSEKGTKKPTVAKADGTAEEAVGDGKGSKGKGKAKQKAACRLWKTDDGCKYGRACQFQHDSLSPSDKRCFNCGSLKHRKPDCTRPKAAATPPPGEGGSNAAQVEDSAKSKGEGPSTQDQLKC